ncbi:hypothetical protein PAMA_001049 [Pampus argenteus]
MSDLSARYVYAVITNRNDGQNYNEKVKVQTARALIHRIKKHKNPKCHHEDGEKTAAVTATHDTRQDLRGDHRSLVNSHTYSHTGTVVVMILDPWLQLLNAPAAFEECEADFSCDETDKGPPVQMHSLREFEQVRTCIDTSCLCDEVKIWLNNAATQTDETHHLKSLWKLSVFTSKKATYAMKGPSELDYHYQSGSNGPYAATYGDRNTERKPRCCSRQQA